MRSTAKPDPRPSPTPTLQSHDLLTCIRRGEVDAVMGAGPLAGEVLIVKTHHVEEENRRLIDALETEKETLEELGFQTAHDLREPLVSIESEIAMLLEQYARLRLPLWFGDSLRQIEQASLRMRRLVSDLMTLGEMGSRVQPSEGVALVDLVARVLDSHRQQLARTRVQVEIVDDLPVVRGRLRHFEAIYRNLIDNAVRYAAATTKGKVRIGCDRSGDELVLWVRDNGPGFDPRDAEAVFEPYVRLDRSGDNCGLGLAIVRSAVQTHGGRAWIETEPGKGAKVSFTLPADCCESTAPSYAPSP